MIKDIVKKLKPSANLQINEETKRLQNQGKKVYKFGFGQSPFPVPEVIVAALKNSANNDLVAIIGTHYFGDAMSEIFNISFNLL